MSLSPHIHTFFYAPPLHIYALPPYISCSPMPSMLLLHHRHSSLTINAPPTLPTLLLHHCPSPHAYMHYICSSPMHICPVCVQRLSSHAIHSLPMPSTLTHLCPPHAHKLLPPIDALPIHLPHSILLDAPQCTFLNMIISFLLAGG